MFLEICYIFIKSLGKALKLHKISKCVSARDTEASYEQKCFPTDNPEQYWNKVKKSSKTLLEQNN